LAAKSSLLAGEGNADRIHSESVGPGGRRQQGHRERHRTGVCKGRAKILIVARDGRQVEAAAEEIAAAGGTATGFTADLTNAGQIREAARTAAARYGGLDVLCANAGVFPQAKLEDMKPELWDEVMSTNLKARFCRFRPASLI
jgi:NAD(P)-dependent dehydrogenase (short-subunit alcohol dehydrogenase family)